MLVCVHSLGPRRLVCCTTSCLSMRARTAPSAFCATRLLPLPPGRRRSRRDPPMDDTSLLRFCAWLDEVNDPSPGVAMQ